MKNISWLLVMVFYLFTPLRAQRGKANNKKKCSIVGNYQYLSADKMSGISVELNYDSTFIYHSGGDISTYHSDGKWKIIGDTLVLNSYLLKNNIPIQVKEEEIDSLKDWINFKWVDNLDKDIMNAILFFNEDTTSECEPFTATNCKVKVGKLDSILIKFGNGATSMRYHIKNKKANKISITASIHELLEKYLFLHDEKYFYKDGYLYSVNSSDTVLRRK